MDPNDLPAQFPTRLNNGQWEVLVVVEGDAKKWWQCASEDDARIIARAPLLNHEWFQWVGSEPVRPEFQVECKQLLDAMARIGLLPINNKMCRNLTRVVNDD